MKTFKELCINYTEDCFCFFILRADQDRDLGRKRGYCKDDRNIMCYVLIEHYMEQNKLKNAEFILPVPVSWDAPKKADIFKDILYGMGFNKIIVENIGRAEAEVIIKLAEEGELLFSPMERALRRSVSKGV